MKTEAQKRATAKYESKAYNKITLRVRKDKEPTRETITAAATAAGESLNEYIVNSIIERMQN